MIRLASHGNVVRNHLSIGHIIVDLHFQSLDDLFCTPTVLVKHLIYLRFNPCSVNTDIATHIHQSLHQSSVKVPECAIRVFLKNIAAYAGSG